MKIIDLLNRIANGEEVPEKIKYCTEVFIFNKDNCNFLYKYQAGKCQLFGCCRLNDEVEILEEKEMCHKCHKYPVEYNQTYCEFCLGISKLEEKKIPEKLKLYTLSNNDSADFTTLQDFNNRDIQKTINCILDYLKSKGE